MPIVQDAVEFSGLYLEALDEEVVALQSYIGTHKPASTLKIDKLEEKNRSGDGLRWEGEI